MERKRHKDPLSLQPHPPALFLFAKVPPGPVASARREKERERKGKCNTHTQNSPFPLGNFFPTEAEFVDQSPSVLAAAAVSSAVTALRDHSSNAVTLDKFNSRLSEVTGIPSSRIKLCQDAQLIILAETVATVTLRTCGETTKYQTLQIQTSNLAPQILCTGQGKAVIDSYSLDKPETPTDLQDVIF